MERVACHSCRPTIALRTRAGATLGALVTLGVPVAASAQAMPNTAAVEVIGSARLEKNRDLDFGAVIPGTTGGAITITPGGAVSTTGTVVAAGGAPHSASFTMQRRIFVDYPTLAAPTGADTLELELAGAPGTIVTLRNFTTNYSFWGYFFSTEYTFAIGGTLDIGANQPAGVYSGTFLVSLDYE